jgi:hypothetical protein
MPPRPTPTRPVHADADHRARLLALRDRLTDELDASPSSAAVAALARQLQAVLAELASMRDPDRPPTALDQLAARHNARRRADVPPM